MKNDLQAKIGLSNLHFAIEKEADVYEVLKHPYMKSMKLEIESEEVVDYADDMVVYQASVSSKGTIEAETKDMPMKNYEFLYGAKKDDNGVLIDNVNDQSPVVACMYRETLTNGNFRYVCIPQVKGIKPNFEASTKTDKISITDEKLKFNVTPLENGNIAYYFITNDLSHPVALSWFEKPYKPKFENVQTI